MSNLLPAPLRREGREVLAIALGTRRKEHVLRGFPAVRSEPGYRVVHGRVEPWHLEGFFSEGDTLYLYGPGEKGRLLETVIAGDHETLREGERPRALPYLERLAAALATLEAAGILLSHLQTDAVLFLDAGGVLFLPPGLMRKAGELRPGSHMLQVFEPINHPDWLPLRRGGTAGSGRRGTAHLSFALGALAHKGILGEYPFEADSEEEIHNRTRHLRLTPPSVRLPGLKAEAGQLILRALGREDEAAPSLEEWARELSRWNREGLFQPLDPQARRELAERGSAHSQRAAQAYRRRVFWQRKGLTVAIVAVIVTAVGILAGTYLRTLLAPRATLGFGPRQVVEAYLQGLNSLDHALMEDCTVDGAGKQTIREVINIYVMSRVTMGYEGRSNILPADQWDRMGRPPLEPPETVFGVTDLELRAVRGEPEPLFDASYTLWTPVPMEDSPPKDPPPGQEAGGDTPGAGQPRDADMPYGPTVAGRDVTERYFLRSHRGYWVIYRIEPG